MSTIPIIFAKLAALYKEVSSRDVSDVSNQEVLDYLDRYSILRAQIVTQIPELYSDMPKRLVPAYASLIDRDVDFRQLVRDMAYIFEVRANSEIVIGKTEDAVEEKHPERIFISHGRSPDWREVQAYIEKDLHIDTLELAQQPNQGRTVLQKLNDESEKCSFAVVVMTGDDEVGTGAPRARENVLHEIGFFQGKLGLENVCLLHEEGTNIPSNIHGLVYIPFPKGLVSAGFGVLAREIKVALAKLT